MQSVAQTSTCPTSSSPTSPMIESKFRSLGTGLQRLASFLHSLVDVASTETAKRAGVAVAFGIVTYQLYKIFQSIHNKRLNSSALLQRELAVAKREREVEARRNDTQIDTDIATHEHLAHVFLKSAVQHADTALDLKKEKKKMEVEAAEVRSNLFREIVELSDLDATLQ